MSENTLPPVLQASGVHKHFGRREVLHHIDLALQPQEILTLIGPNGSGKTTLLQVLLGLTPPSRGHVTRRPGLRIGYVPQKASFDPVMPLTVYDFLRLFGAPKSIIATVAEEVGIPTYLHRQLYALSGGELQRVLLAQALLGRPELLVLDEPVQGVDFGGQAELYKLIRTTAKARNCAVLMVSHDLHLVMADTDRVICLNRHICCSGTPQDVSRDPAFINLFGTNVAGQVAYYVHHHDHQHTLGEESLEKCSHDS